MQLSQIKALVFDYSYTSNVKELKKEWPQAKELNLRLKDSWVKLLRDFAKSNMDGKTIDELRDRLTATQIKIAEVKGNSQDYSDNTYLENLEKRKANILAEIRVLTEQKQALAQVTYSNQDRDLEAAISKSESTVDELYQTLWNTPFGTEDYEKSYHNYCDALYQDVKKTEFGTEAYEKAYKRYLNGKELYGKAKGKIELKPEAEPTFIGTDKDDTLYFLQDNNFYYRIQNDPSNGYQFCTHICFPRDCFAEKGFSATEYIYGKAIASYIAYGFRNMSAI